MKLSSWSNLPPAVHRHLDERLADRSITAGDLQKLRFWIQGHPDVPAGDWYKDFGSFILCGSGEYPKTF